MHKFFLLGLLLVSSIHYSASAQPLNTKQIDSLVNKTLSTFDVPGIAVGILKDGKLIHAKGYGIRSVKSNVKVDEHTLFGVASNTKAMTTACLGMLVDENKITWDTKVTDILPEFKLYDAYVTSEFTIRDLLTHRSGLGLGAGDLMIWPDSSTVDTKQLIHNLRFLKPVSSFRTQYDYDNLMYIVAGEVIARVSGISYSDFLEKRLLQPLGMTASAASWYRLKNRSNIIDGHAPYQGKLLPVGLSFSEVANAAGGVYSNIVDMSKWVNTMLNGGKYGDQLQQKLISTAVHKELWSPQTIIKTGAGAYNTHFAAYGLGWNLADVNGFMQVSHTGGLSGIVTQVTLIPELKLGIIVLTNQQSGAAFTAITNTIKDGYFNIKGKDRIKENNDRRLNNEQEADKVVSKVWSEVASAQNAKLVKPDLQNFYASYKDAWFGVVSIQNLNGKMIFRSKNSPKLIGEMSYYKGNTFIVKWNDRSLDADAFVNFSLDTNGLAKGFTVEAISPMTDFSFDFQDLDFTRIP